jgi:hypothetical protein
MLLILISLLFLWRAFEHVEASLRVHVTTFNFPVSEEGYWVCEA